MRLMLIAVSVILTLCLAGAISALIATKSPLREAVLRWSPPALTTPQTIRLQGGMDPEHLTLNTGRDYVLVEPSGGIHGTLEIDGGHNVVLVGGSITVPSSANQTDNGADNTDTALYIRRSTGTVHIEGLFITGDPNTQFDGIDINAPQATVQLENIRMTNVWGSYTTEHADVIQTWGGVKDLRVDHLSASGDYQGLTVDPDSSPVGQVELQNVDLTLDPSPAALRTMTVGGGHMVWLTRGVSTCNAPAHVSLVNVFVVNRVPSRVSTGQLVWPEGNGSSLSCAAEISGKHISWPNLAVTGSITAGTPPGGAFVTPAAGGPSYTSPGYSASRTERNLVRSGR